MDKKEKLVKEYKKLIEFCEKYSMDEYVEGLKAKLLDLEEPLKIMIVGEGKSGKSTLLNALVGREVAEVDDLPKTWCINVYYNATGKEYAELVYKDEIKIVSLEEAKKISERIGTSSSRRKEQVELLESDYELREIRWHMKLEWPQENVLLIDTPGFNQVRYNTRYQNISIDGAEGIQYEAQDGFETFQNKADILLWCFDANSSNDREVQQKLESVPIDSSRIYGIVTKLDCVDDSERVFKYNERKYKGYLKECIRSGLPMLFDDDERSEKEKKKKVRDDSVKGIRWCIDYLLKDNANLDIIKYESSAAYLSGMIIQVISTLQSYLSFYFENYKIYKDAVRIFCEDQLSERIRIEQEIITLSRSIYEKLVDEGFLSQLWFSAGENAELYSELLTQQIDKDGMVSRCDKLIEEYQKETNNIWEHGISNIKWKDILIRRNPKEEHEFIEHNTVITEKVQVPKYERITVKIGDMGLVYKLIKWAESAGIGNLVKAVASKYLCNKAIEMGREAVGECLKNSESEYCDYILKQQYNIVDAYLSYIKNRFNRQTGQNTDSLEDTILTIEKTMTENKWYSEDVPYYPIIEEDKVVFVQSMYCQELLIYQEQDSKIILKWMDEKVISPIFKEYKKNLYKEYKKSLWKYDGTKAIDMPVFDYVSDNLCSNINVRKQIPFFDQIVWGKLFGELKNQYIKCYTEFKIYCENMWHESCKECVNEFIKKEGREIQTKLYKETGNFINVWSKQLRDIVNMYVAQNNLYMKPKEYDYMFFFQYYYYPMHPSECTIILLNEYEKTKQIPKSVEKQMRHVDPNGNSLEAIFGKILRETMENNIRLIIDNRNQAMAKWDKSVNEYLLIICDNYEKVFQQMDKEMEEVVMPAWEEYIIKSENFGVSRINNSIDYMRKSGKMSKQYLKILDSEISISEIGTWGYYIFSGGKSLYDSFLEWLKDRNNRFDRKWRNEL